jgi:GH18 family chitinase
MRRRGYRASNWHTRLNTLMAEVLENPERYHPSIGHWARWRARWLAERARREGGVNFYEVTPETAARDKFSQAAADLMPRSAAEEAECD